MSKKHEHYMCVAWENNLARINGFLHALIIRVCFLLCVCCSVTNSYANVPNHFIIAFDRSIPNYKDVYGSKNTLKSLDEVMRQIGFDSENDYISILGYTMNLSNPQLKDFITPYELNGEKLIWKHLANKSFYNTFTQWPEVKPGLVSGDYASTQSITKPFAVMETAINPESLEVSGHTYLIMVTDDQLNGSKDYRKEWRAISSLPISNMNVFDGIKGIVFDQLHKFDDEFKFSELTEVNEMVLSTNGTEPYKIIPYELTAAEVPSIHGYTDLPSPLPLFRVRGGVRLAFDSHSLSDKYIINKVKIYNSQGHVYSTSDSGDLDIIIPSKEITAGDSLFLDMSLRLKDGLYNGMLISPENQRYKKGMTVRQSVRFEDAKIFGVIPLSDLFWWFYPNDVKMAVFTWQVILILILVGIVIFSLYYWNKRTLVYKVDYDELKLKCVESPESIFYKEHNRRSKK